MFTCVYRAIPCLRSSTVKVHVRSESGRGPAPCHARGSNPTHAAHSSAAVPGGLLQEGLIAVSGRDRLLDTIGMGQHGTLGIETFGIML